MSAASLSLLARRATTRGLLQNIQKIRRPVFHQRAFCTPAIKQDGDLTKVDKVSPDDDDGTGKPGVVGGFMRGLMGGHSVAADDAFIAEAKKAGVELPPQPPPRTELVATKRRRRSEEEESEGEGIRDRLFSRFSGSSFMRGAFEAKERIAERIDESDNAFVNWFRNVFAENEMGQVIREIRLDDKSFRVSDFLEHLEKGLIPEIIGNYLIGDRDALKSSTTEEAYNMLNASIKEREVTGVTMDTNILAINDVELSAARLLEDAPVLIVSFSLQQINCLRNQTGDIVEGAEDDIRAVYYLMAFVREFDDYEEDTPTGGGMGSENSGEENAEAEKEDEYGSTSDDEKKGKDSKSPPPWKMMEMVIRGAHSTI